MMNREFLELGQILIDFPLSYRFIKELTIREEANGTVRFSCGSWQTAC